MVNDAGGTSKGYFSNSVDVRDKYLLKLSYIKSCLQSVNEGCWHKANNWGGYDGTLSSLNYQQPSVILSNGTLMVFVGFSPNCTGGWGEDFNWCGEWIVDVNGFKKPNAFGKDIFAAYVTENSLVPRGKDHSEVDANNCTSVNSGTESGILCSAAYLYQ